jgi:hypothetical protein
MRFLKATSSFVLVLNAKGGEFKAKETGSTTTCEFFKNLSEGILGFLSKSCHCKSYSLVGEKFDYAKKGEFLAFLSMICQNKVF